MASNKASEQSREPAPAPKRGELEAKDLDKVTGGMMKPAGTQTVKVNKTVIGDPCEGGQ